MLISPVRSFCVRGALLDSLGLRLNNAEPLWRVWGEFLELTEGPILLT
jgi:hypothetical protein